MRKRSRAGGQPAKAQRRKTAARKSHITPKALHPRSSSAARKETKVARLTRERDEALAQRTATSELLSVINRSKFDLQAILQGVLDSAARLCRADKSVIFRLEHGVYRFVAAHGAPPAYVEIERATPILPGPGTLVGRTAMKSAGGPDRRCAYRSALRKKGRCKNWRISLSNRRATHARERTDRRLSGFPVATSSRLATGKQSLR